MFQSETSVLKLLKSLLFIAVLGVVRIVNAQTEYHAARSFEKANTKVIVDYQEGLRSSSAEVSQKVEEWTKNIVDGERVVIHYSLNREENLKYHLSRMKSDLSEIRRETVKARRATRPDTKARVAELESLALSMDEEIQAARAQSSAPEYVFEIEIALSAGNRQAANRFLSDTVKGQGKVLQVSHMPVDATKKFAMLLKKAGGRLMGAISGGSIFKPKPIGFVSSGIETAAGPTWMPAGEPAGGPTGGPSDRRPANQN